MRNNQVDSSLNEIDVEMGNILLKQMLIADTRTITPASKKPLWDASRIVQVDDLNTEDIFTGYLLSNPEKHIDITYPLLGYKANNIDEVFYGTGNRVRQWNFELPAKSTDINVNDVVYIIKGNYAHRKGIVQKKIDNTSFEVFVPDVQKFTQVSIDNLRLRTLDSTTTSFKAKQIQMTYDVAILSQMRKESRYLMDKFILRCADGQIWHAYDSHIVNGTEFHIFTVFDIPNLHKCSNDEEKIKGIGFVYAVSFKVHVWAYLADEPLPTGFIEQIELNLRVKNSDFLSRITI